MNTNTPTSFHRAIHWPTTMTGDPHTDELRWIAAAFLSTTAELKRTDVELARREWLVGNVHTLVEVVSLNCKRIPIEAAQLILMDALTKTRAQFPEMIAEYGDLLDNPAPFVDVYADNVVELESHMRKLISK